MNEERKRILDLLAGGKITSDEAERLLEALGHGPAPDSPKAAPKFLRVLVLHDERDEEAKKVNIRVPFQLLRAGIKLAAVLPPEARDEVNRAFREKGIDIDLSRVKSGELEEVLTELAGLTVDVEAGEGKRVKIFCE